MGSLRLFALTPPWLPNIIILFFLGGKLLFLWSSYTCEELLSAPIVLHHCNK